MNAGGEQTQRVADHGGLEPPDYLLSGLGRNLRRLRTQRGFSLERFSKQCGVSRGMLGQIETGKSMPTLGILWKIATALDVPFAKLLGSRDEDGTHVLRKDDTPVIVSDRGGLQSRALFPKAGDCPEFYELRLSPAHLHLSEPHAPGTRENLVVVSGTVEVTVGDSAPFLLARGDSIFFEADAPHSYRNADDYEAVLYLVVSYLQKTPAALNGHS
ncbi:helix-turn-helix domain-containing protein [Rhodomicrobium lacus]|uniref:helix-turn-helix domain-containing protein n=1 Tax=Rhodomicrobium lacus TaxID=2498452 RepID=UPI001AECDCC3|nr:XRE family transcriptional regulator [Rhodomicrobium lacus]